jgi:hypothetical protein
MTADTLRPNRPTSRTNLRSYFVAPIVEPIILVLGLLAVVLYTG